MFEFLNSFIFRSEILDSIIFFFAVTLSYITLAIGFGWWIFFPRSKDLASWLKSLPGRILKSIYTIVSVGGAYIVVRILKELFKISRPFEGENGIQSLFLHSGGDSFPSGHATAFAALATVIYFHNKKLGIIFWVIAILISLSRVIAGVHYPIDIAVGLLIGGLFGLMMNKTWRKLEKITTY